jgi:hypothetical protein
MNEGVENWANLHKSGLIRSGLKIQLALLPRQFTQQRALHGGSVQQRVCPQQHGGISQQRHAPSQSQAVEEHRAQSELIFLVRLSWFNPRTDWLQQLAGGQRVERQQSQQGFVSFISFSWLMVCGLLTLTKYCLIISSFCLCCK